MISSFKNLSVVASAKSDQKSSKQSKHLRTLSKLTQSMSLGRSEAESIINHQSPNISISQYLNILISLSLSLFLSSCADKTAETPPPTEKKDQARLVGRIASIHKNPDFALIQSYGTWNVPTGAILATMGLEGRAANLKVTGEKTGQFAAADIQSGTLEIGDSVYTTLSYQAPKEEEETAPETKENEALPIEKEG
jgi:hypothetical protein